MKNNIKDAMGQPIYYTAAGGVVVHQQKVLVLLRPSRHEVRLPKGHIEEGENAQTAALREVGEESGYTGLEIKADLGRQTVEFEYQGRRIVRNERYFLMGLRDEMQRESGETQFEPLWLTWPEALDQLSFSAEREWVRRANTMLQEKNEA